MDKILFMSHCVPPIVRGPSILISRLFSKFSGSSCTVLTSKSFGKELLIDEKLKLPCRYYYADVETIIGGYRQTLFGVIRKWIDTWAIVRKGLEVIKKEGCNKIVISPTHGNFFYAVYWIYRIMGIKYYVYFFDLFDIENSTSWIDRVMRKISLNLALKSAECVFVMSEKLKDYYRVRYPDLKVEVLRHPIEKKRHMLNSEDIKANDDISNTKKIIFTGMIYEYQIDAIQNLARAVNELEEIEFHIYTQREKEYLDVMGVTGKNVVYCGYADNEELFDIQRSADILFLPMSFYGEGTNSDVIKTASPSKISEYLAADKPILVHGPPDAYVTWYARRYGFGFVVDTQDKAKLKDAIKQLLVDKQLRQELVINAKKLSEKHELSSVSQYFKRGLGLANA